MNGADNTAYNEGSIEMMNTDRTSKSYDITNNNVNSKKNENQNRDLEDGKKIAERPTWANGVEFLMSCISMSVGLGNIWRFPFTAYENGGGAFLIPYIIVLFVIGKPIYYLEMAIGQFSSQSSIKVWELSPIFKGIGIAQMLATTCVITYYTSLIALTLYYLMHSFTSELPWSYCRPEWGINCVNSKIKTVSNFSRIRGNETLTKATEQVLEGKKQSSSELYFLNVVLKEKSDISDGIGAPDWQLTLWLLLAWVVIVLIMVRGVRSTGKAAYFLALFPYVIIITLLVKACTLEGAVDGIIYFFRPQWSQLLNPDVWYKATTQLFFSLSVGMGTIIMFSSYNQFNHNIYRDALIVTSLDTCTSLLGGTTVFAILGNLAFTTGAKDISEVINSGTGLAFISYPDTISKFDVASQVFSVLFFFMLFTLGIGTIVALQSAIVTVVCDQFPRFTYWHVGIFAGICGFLCGLIYLTPGGQWMLTLIDHYGGTFLVFIIAIFEIVGIFWVYGLENFCIDIEFMTNRKLSCYWRCCWGLITPVFLIVIFIYSLAQWKPLTYSGYSFPDSAIIAGWMIIAIGLLIIPIWIIWLIAHKKSDLSILNRLLKEFQPSDIWGPKEAKTKEEWKKYKQDAIEKRQRMAAEGGHSFLRQKLCILFGKYN